MIRVRRNGGFPTPGPLASSNAVLTLNGLKAFPQAATQEWRKGLLPLVEDASAACGKTFNSRRFPQAAIKTWGLKGPRRPPFKEGVFHKRPRITAIKSRQK